MAWSRKVAFEKNMFGSFVGGDGKAADGHGDLSLPSIWKEISSPQIGGWGEVTNFLIEIFCLIFVIPLKTHTHYFSYILIGDKIGRQKLYVFPFHITPKQGKKDFISFLYQAPKQGDGTHISIPFHYWPLIAITNKSPKYSLRAFKNIFISIRIRLYSHFTCLAIFFCR